MGKTRKRKYKYPTQEMARESTKASKRRWYHRNFGSNKERIERVEKQVQKNVELVKSNESRIENIERFIDKMKWGEYKTDLDNRKPELLPKKQGAVNPPSNNPREGTDNSGAPLASKGEIKIKKMQRGKEPQMNLFSKGAQDDNK